MVVLPASLLPPQPSLVSSPGLAWRGGADCLPAGGCVREQPRPDSMLCFGSNSAAGATTTSSISIYLSIWMELCLLPFRLKGAEGDGGGFPDGKVKGDERGEGEDIDRAGWMHGLRSATVT